MAITKPRRQLLIDKYMPWLEEHDDPDWHLPLDDVREKPRANPTVSACLDSGTIVAKTFLREHDYAEMFDPDRSPEMWARAIEAVGALHKASARGEIGFVSASGPVGVPQPNPLDNPFDEHVTLMHCVGDYRVFVCRNQPDNFSVALFVAANFGQGGSCMINVADDCGVVTRQLPLEFGTLLLVFECCDACLIMAGRLADHGLEASVAVAQAELPPGARIHPGSPVPPTS
jgi:hypothetical protein